MSTASLQHSTDSLRANRRYFFLRRLHSLSGVVPVGVFLVEHLWTNARAVYGRDAFNRAVGDIQALPLLVYIELFGIVLPLAFHALYGVVIALQGSVNVQRYGYTRNWMYLLQRLSGVVVLLFVGVHLWQYRVAKMLGRVAWADFYHQLSVDLNRGAIFALYVTGVTASVFHFANGLWLFGNSWGITLSERAQRRSAVVCSVLGFALWALALNTLLHFAFRCGGVIPLPEQSVREVCGLDRI
jgi:succinate dehydrogenase/fumarate reductase cytochrome b subunit (b558 family)